MSFDGSHHGGDHHHGHSHTSHSHSGHNSHSHINTNEHGGISSITVHDHVGSGVINQSLTGHGVHMTDGHNHIVYSTSEHSHGHNHGNHHGHDHHGLGHDLNHHSSHGTHGNLGHIQSASDPLSQASNAKFPSLKI